MTTTDNQGKFSLQVHYGVHELALTRKEFKKWVNYNIRCTRTVGNVAVLGMEHV